MKFDENKFKEALQNNPKIENNFLDIKKRIERENIVMREPSFNFFEKLKDFSSKKAFKVSFATIGGLVVISAIILGSVLPTLGGNIPSIDVKTPPIFIGVEAIKESDLASQNSYAKKFSESLIRSEENEGFDEGEKIILDLKFNNPDNFEIENFKITDSEGTQHEINAENYLPSSNYSDIYVDMGLMGEEKISFKVSDIFYLDDEGNSLPVTISGNSSTSVFPTPIPIEETFDISLKDSEIHLSSASFSLDINDSFNMLIDLRVVLLEGSSVVQSFDLEVINNEISLSFEELKSNTTYTFNVIADVTKEGVISENETIFTNEFTTIKYFDEIVVNPSFTTLNVEIENLNSIARIDSTVILNAEDEVIKTASNLSSSLTFEGLNSNTNYSISITFSENGNYPLTETREFKTLSYEVPTCSFSNVKVEGNKVSFAFEENDPYDLGNVSKIELYQGENLIQETNANTTFFSNLNPEGSFSLVGYYSYNLKDGTGSHETSFTSNFETQITPLRIANIQVNSSIPVNQNIQVKIQLYNPSALAIKEFIVSGEKYSATEFIPLDKQHYLITMNGIANSGVYEYELTGYTYELNGTLVEASFDVPKNFTITIN